MRQNDLVEIIKAELHTHIDQLNIEHVTETKAAIESQFAILEAIERAHFYPGAETEAEPHDILGNAENTEVMPACPGVVLNAEDTETTLVESISEDKGLIRGYFNQFLRGGCLLPPEHEDSVFVPEKIVRNMDLQAGDFVQATRSNLDNPNEKAMHDYTMIQRTKTASEAVRHVANFATVSSHKDLQRFYISFKPVNSEVYFEAMLGMNDIERFGIVEGDIIDYAYRPENPGFGKIIWKYDSSQAGASKIKNNVKTFKIEKELKKKDVEPTLTDINVLTIGGMPHNLSQSAKEEVEKRKGCATTLSGDEPRDSIVSEIRKSDIVVIYTESISHDAMYLAKETCKKWDKKFLFTKNTGGLGIIRQLEQEV